MAVFTQPIDRPPLMAIEEHEYESAEKTIVVLGLPGGGTSVTAAIIDALGVPIVRDIDAPNFEHTQLVNATPIEAAVFVKDCDSRFTVWGFKNPHLISYPTFWLKRNLRKPYYVVVCKDPASIAVRSWATAGTPFSSERDAFQYESQRLIQFLGWIAEIRQAPIAVLGYYEMLRSPKRTCEMLSDFLGIESDEETIQKAVSRVSKDGGYLISD